MALVRIGVDIGGTFTDLTGWRSDDAAALHTFKVPSTPPHFERGFRDGLERMLDLLSVTDGDHVIIMHGTTVSTNTVIERSAEPVALFVTEGFRDILELQRLRLRNPIDFYSGRVEPLVRRNLVHEIPERLDSDGNVVVPLDEAAVREAVRKVRAAGLRGIAVAFLHSFQAPGHERRVEALVRDEDPEMDVCLSSAVWPRVGEYERAMNAVLNIYVKPRVKSYLDDIRDYVAGRVASVQLFVTRSNGGALGLAEAARFPIHTLLSGPASGVTATQGLVASAGHEYILSFDMGGTSTDVSLVHRGRPSVASQGTVGDFPVTLPVTEIEAIGAGGGSIVRLDGPALMVGPESAGAFPGPAAFGRGGDRPTVTDAYALCGYLNPDRFLGGTMALDPGLSERAFAPIAGLLGRDVAAAADACLSVTTSNMVNHILPFLALHGVDAQNVTLVAFGGNGALHAPLLADEIGITHVMVPPAPSVFCAYGGIVTRMTNDSVVVVHGTRLDDAVVAAQFRRLRAESEDWLGQQIDAAHLVAVDHEYWADVRYKGQSFQLPVQVHAGPGGAMPDIARITDAFHDEHLRLHAHCDRTLPVEIVELRVRIHGTLGAPATRVPVDCPERRVAPVARRDIRIAGVRHPQAPVYQRSGFVDGAAADGPCIIEQDDATILVPASYAARALSTGTIVLSRKE